MPAHGILFGGDTFLMSSLIVSLVSLLLFFVSFTFLDRLRDFSMYLQRQTALAAVVLLAGGSRAH